jgi:phosphoserine phosphatase
LPSIAVIFDFDDTLAPDTTTDFLVHKGISPTKWWTKSLPSMVKQGYDPTLGYLNLLLAEVAPGKKLAGLSNAELRAFGSKLKLFPEVVSLLKDLRKKANEYRVEIGFYIISGGLRELILGIPGVKRNFTAVYGCELGEEDGVVRSIKRCITFTEKTRYVFEINKGIKPQRTLVQPYLVNVDVKPEKRAVPLANMIYVGDGLTDIPCFSLIGKNGGRTYGVFDPENENKAKRAFVELLKTKRVEGLHSPAYGKGKGQDLGVLIRAAVSNRCSEINLDLRSAITVP